MSEIIDEDQAFADLIATIIDRRRKQGLALIPDWIAAEATHELDPNRISHPVIYEACRLHLRHIASGILGIEPKSTARDIPSDLPAQLLPAG